MLVTNDQIYTNEYRIAISGAFYFYKRFISSQDGSQCSFTPSCSEYAVLAIEKQGLIKGGLNFLDRFSRCNSLSPELYSRDPETHLLIDPVKNIKYEVIP
ncbi:MAG: membrane protein insertion efficiency factor YidD [Bacteroidia bacterium]|nr:membrane protein insertion efficiency factor YidD [Bacteroidales bacterium]NCD42671.1 membrane protein insertion efficiency factor YidD [Bacteroidia bacterium]MDD2323625.1 membrane protein insertion efficiency factor YidD [Bacteroidales bacterium]MDD3011547.1 membrane protein insertion efficiency factor YidD [Bacteroidales bacterium]MDD3960414.1 membrane protein insertion efficiency factor YidD [Bacteroidales bacterium]